jgi:hypothetical protein
VLLIEEDEAVLPGVEVALVSGVVLCAPVELVALLSGVAAEQGALVALLSGVVVCAPVELVALVSGVVLCDPVALVALVSGVVLCAPVELVALASGVVLCAPVELVASGVVLWEAVEPAVLMLPAVAAAPDPLVSAEPAALCWPAVLLSAGPWVAEGAAWVSWTVAEAACCWLGEAMEDVEDVFWHVSETMRTLSTLYDVSPWAEPEISSV